MISFYENHNHDRWLSVVKAKTPSQIFDELSSLMAKIIPSTSLRERL
ncbi:MAG: hypothetical protein HC916_01060 [Coleofasciculaceae cyanobacterium SM2_1_6]|nr:hypothetical protein [Coleofasciculaceae cyanobacterium SM2_1_6]